MKSTWVLVSIAAMLGLSEIGAATAADMAVKARPLPVVAPYSWTGCYVGVEGGGSWGRDRTISNGTNNGVDNGTGGALKTTTDISGGLVGGTLGCNYQVNQWVFGIEGDNSWSGEQGSSSLVPPFNTSFREDLSQSWIATIRGRVGFVVNQKLLFYGTAGGAFADLRFTNSIPPAQGVPSLGLPRRISIPAGPQASAPNGDLPLTGRPRLNTFTWTWVTKTFSQPPRPGVVHSSRAV